MISDQCGLKEDIKYCDIFTSWFEQKFLKVGRWFVWSCYYSKCVMSSIIWNTSSEHYWASLFSIISHVATVDPGYIFSTGGYYIGILRYAYISRRFDYWFLTSIFKCEFYTKYDIRKSLYLLKTNVMEMTTFARTFLMVANGASWICSNKGNLIHLI